MHDVIMHDEFSNWFFYISPSEINQKWRLVPLYALKLLLRIQKARRLSFFFRQGACQKWLHRLCASVHKDSYAVRIPSGSPPNGGLIGFILDESHSKEVLGITSCQILLVTLLTLRLYRLSQKLKPRVVWKAEGSGWGREGERGREREWERE